MDEGDRIYMTELLAQLKMARDRKEAAEAEMETWVDRMALAKKAGKEDLFDAARERATMAREDVRRAESQIMELEVEKDAFKKGIKRVPTEGTEQAEKLIDDLADKPWNPADAKLDRMTREAGADAALAELKRKLQQGE